MADAGTLRKVESLPAWGGGSMTIPPHNIWPTDHKTRRSTPPEMIVIHCTAGSTTKGAFDTMKARGFSSHLIIPDNVRTGEPPATIRLMSDEYYSYHVRNAVLFNGRPRINSRSFGIEIVHTGQTSDEYSSWQVDQAVAWCCFWMSRNPSIRWVATHAYLDPTRRIDPTVKFPWDRFIAEIRARADDADAQNSIVPALSWDGQEVDAEIIIEDGTSYVAVAELAKHLGKKVKWNAAQKKVEVF